MKRRTLVSSAGWAVPAAIVASASPALAASSPCTPQTVRFTDDGWSSIIDRVGQHPYNYRQPNADAVAVGNGSWRSVADQILAPIRPTSRTSSTISRPRSPWSRARK